jgi:ATP-dependent DNA helicase PIF1
MPRYQEWRVATAAKRKRLAVDFVRDNPHIVAFWFQKRIELFKKHVLFPKYKVVDFWDRFEWQARGSTHSHGLYYCADTPSPDVELSSDSSELTVARFAQYWDRHISAIHPRPDLSVLVDEGSTLSLPFLEMRFTNGELGSILTRCYKHVCTEQYCLRKDKITKSMRCRFEAPWPLRETPTFEKPTGKSYQRFQPVRNHARLNAYSPILPLGWRANTDIQVCTSTTGVVQYMGVYVSKGEVQSAPFKDIARGILPFVKEAHSMKSFATKLMNSLVGERDYSAQEVCHLLMGAPLTHCSRIFVNVDCRPEQAQDVTFAFRDGARPSEDAECDDINFKQGRSVLEKYKLRLPTHELVLYLDFLLHFSYDKTAKRRVKAKPRILNFMPRYSPIAEPDHFARVKLMLHHPFREVDEVLTINGNVFDTFTAAYSYCRSTCSHSLVDSYGLPNLGVDEEDPNLEPPEDLEMDDFDELAGRQPGSQGLVVDQDGLGNRPLDRLHDWNDPQHDDTFALNPLSYWKEMKQSYDGPAPSMANTEPNTLQPKQRLVYDLFTNHYAAYLRGLNPPQQFLNLDGEGGTGKTYLISCITCALNRMAAEVGARSPLLRCAPTGVSANLINGRTIHSLFNIPILPKGGTLEPLLAAAKQQMQAAFEGVKYVIIDEKSMIGLAVLSWIHSRCGEALPGTATYPFAGLNIIIAGDFWQLPPVGRRPLFDHTSKSSVDSLGATLYRKYFTRTVELDTVMRQLGDSQKPFRDALGRLRLGKSTLDDWSLLMTRCRVALSTAEKVAFDTTVRLCAKRVDVALINYQYIRDFKRPVLAVSAKHDNPAWANINANDAGNLEARLTLCVGASIMLLQNIWTEHGLVNGATGIIHNIIWDAGVEDRRVKPPKALLLIIEGYTGPALFTTNAGEKVIPVFPISRDFWDASTRTGGARFQFPTCLAWAITIHKSQGMSLFSAVVKCDEDFVPGLLYVALSRVKTLEGLMFDQPMTFQRLKGKASSLSENRQKDYERRKKQHLTSAHVVFE